MTTFTLDIKKQNEILALIEATNPSVNMENLRAIVAVTNPIKGCSIISIRDYKSDASDNTETANCVVNLGASYETMKSKFKQLENNLTLESIDFTYDKVSMADFLGGLESHKFGGYLFDNLETFKAEIKAAFLIAKAELITPVERKKAVDNNLWINKVLVYNTKTGSICVNGQVLSKTVTEVGEYKKVKSSAKTVAKNIIREICEPKTELLRKYKLSLMSYVKIRGNEIECGDNEF